MDALFTVTLKSWRVSVWTPGKENHTDTENFMLRRRAEFHADVHERSRKAWRMVVTMLQRLGLIVNSK